MPPTRAAMDPRHCLFAADDHFVHQGKEHAQHMFAYRIAVPFGAADTADTPGFGIVGIDKLHAAAETADPFKPRRLVDDGAVDLQPGRYNKALRVLHGSQ